MLYYMMVIGGALALFTVLSLALSIMSYVITSNDSNTIPKDKQVQMNKEFDDVMEDMTDKKWDEFKQYCEDEKNTDKLQRSFPIAYRSGGFCA